MLNKIARLTAVVCGIYMMLRLLIPVTAQDAPLARIILPVRGQTLQGSITIQGSATSPQFASYRVEYALDPGDGGWILINGAVQPVQNGTLAVWNTRPLPDGKYVLRLLVIGSDGTTTETQVKDIILANTLATPNGTVTTTSPITSTSVLTQSRITPGGSANSSSSISTSDIAKAFIKGATYAVYGFLALAAYLLIKKILGFLIHRIFRKPFDYGR